MRHGFNRFGGFMLVLVSLMCINKAAHGQINGTACDVPTGQFITYTAQFEKMNTYATYGYMTFSWSITGGTAQISYTSQDNVIQVKWLSLPGKLKVHVDYYQITGYDEYNIPNSYTLFDSDESELTVAPSPASLPNDIRNSTTVTGYYHNQVPSPLIEATSPDPNVCVPAVSYQWMSSSNPTGPFIPIVNATNADYSFSSPLTQTSYFQRQMTTASATVTYSNVIQLTLIPEISGSQCIDKFGRQETYTAHFPGETTLNYSYSTIDWSVTAGISEVVSNDPNGAFVVKWFSAPGQIYAIIHYYLFSGFNEDGTSNYQLVGIEDGTLTINAGPTTLPNIIQSGSGNTSFSYNQVPDILTETVSTVNQSNCAEPIYQWLSSSSPAGPFLLITGATGYQYNLTTPLLQTTYFQREIIAPGGFISYSNIIKYDLVSVNWENQNYIREHNVLVPGVTDWKTVDQLPIGQKLQTTVYSDGMGRPIEKISREAATPNSSQPGNTWGDIVQFSAYDPLGRQLKQYLPYTTTTELGKFKSAPLAEQPQYYSTNYNEGSAYSEITYDNSPLNRIQNVKSPGTTWAGGIGRSSGYDLNDNGDNIQIFNIGFNAGDVPYSLGAYPANTLLKATYTDENNKQVIEYTNKAGQVILKKVQLDDNPSAGYAGWICTYDVYDDFGRLRYEFQPEAVKWLDANGWSFTVSGGLQVLNELCFRYEYDEKGRNVLKKAPGAKELYMLYDSRDRVVFTQDGNQKNRPGVAQWMVSFYDDLDRQVQTALYNTSKSAAALQTDINNATTTVLVPIPGLSANNLVVNTRDAGIVRYAAGNSIELDPGFEAVNNDAFIAEIDPGLAAGATALVITYASPVAASDINNSSVFTPLQYNYYDDYSYAGAKLFDNGFSNALAYPAAPEVEPIVTGHRIMGMLTGTKIRILGSNTFLPSTIYYDEKGRVIQVLAENIKTGTDITTSQYHFDGRLLSVDTRHTASNTVYNNYTIITKKIYDQVGRLSGIEKKYGTNNFKTIVSYELDDMGRLKAKRLDPGYTGTGKNELESLSYSYNIHSQITGINKDYALKTPGKYNKWGNFFGLYLGYDNRDGVFAAQQLDGHVTGTLWTTQGDDTQRKYDFTYDNAGRLTKALFNEKKQPSDSWSNAQMDFSVTGNNGKIEYDLNGNILTMLQRGVIPGNQTPLNIDDLQYTYTSLSNKLVKVTDNANTGAANGKLGDFSDGTNGSSDDYIYDDNGNLVVDLNKNATALGGQSGANGIRYNFLDKPEEIHIAGKGTIQLIYDARGNKLQKLFTPDGSSVTTTTSYIKGFVYRGDDLQFINFEEGRIRVMNHVSQTNGPDILNMDGNMDLPAGTRGAYDFFIRDYQGNVRMVLTEETHSGRNVCTMETARAANEESLFGQIDANGPTTDNEVRARFPVAGIPGNSSGGGWQDPNIGDYVSRLGNLVSKKVGPNVFLRVMAGDKVNATAQYYYQNPVTNGVGGATLVTDMLVSLAQAISGSAPMGMAHGSVQPSGITGSLGSDASFLATADPDLADASGDKPKAYLTVLFFDERFNFVSEGSFAHRVEQPGSGAPPISIPIDTRAPKNGYAYIYVSNESDETVYFDNMQVSLNHGPIIEEDHYYAYGLRIAGISSRKLGDPYEGLLSNNSLYNDKELIDEADLNWYDYGFRNYDPQIGRFPQLDPLTFEYPFLTPYQYASCEPIANVDQDGAEAANAVGFWGALKSLGGNIAGNLQISVLASGRTSVTWVNDGVAYAKLFSAGTTWTFPKVLLGTVSVVADGYKGNTQKPVLDGMQNQPHGPLPAIKSNFTYVPDATFSVNSPIPSGLSQQEITARTEEFYVNHGRNPDGSNPWWATNKTWNNFANNIALPSIEILSYVDGAGEAVGVLRALKLSEKTAERVLYRGGSSLEMSAADIRSSVDKTTGLMKERGISLNANKMDAFVQKYGGAYEVDLNSIPSELQIKFTSGTHFELAPRQAGMMTLEKYQSLLQQVKLKPFNSYP